MTLSPLCLLVMWGSRCMARQAEPCVSGGSEPAVPAVSALSISPAGGRIGERSRPGPVKSSAVIADFGTHRCQPG